MFVSSPSSMKGVMDIFGRIVNYQRQMKGSNGFIWDDSQLS